MNKAMSSPCYNCPDRSLECHSTCEKYQAYHDGRVAEQKKKLDSNPYAWYKMRKDSLRKARKRKSHGKSTVNYGWKGYK